MRPRVTIPAMGAYSLILRFRLAQRNSGRAVPVTQTIRVAEAFRSEVIASLMSDGSRVRHAVVASIIGHGVRATNHAHAHFLPSDSDADGFLDTVDVWLPTGCDDETASELLQERVLYDALALRDGLVAVPLGAVEPPRAKRWRTATPLTLDRFPKVRGTVVKHVTDSPERQILTALARRGFGAATVTVHAPNTSDRAFILTRKGGGRSLPAYRATLEFDTDTIGPIVLGSTAHFGLGRFGPLLDHEG